MVLRMRTECCIAVARRWFVLSECFLVLETLLSHDHILYQYSLPASKQSLIQVVTGLSVDVLTVTARRHHCVVNKSFIS